MHLTKFSDHSLRLLLYLALHGDRTVSIAEMSRAYGVSPHIMVKVAQLLADFLPRAPSRIRLLNASLEARP